MLVLVQLDLDVAVLDASRNAVRCSRIVIDEIPFEVIDIVTCAGHLHPSVHCRSMSVKDSMAYLSWSMNE